MGASTRNISLAVTAAVVFHVLLLTQKLAVHEHSGLKQTPIKVTIYQEIIDPPKPEPVTERQPVVETKLATQTDDIKQRVEPSPPSFILADELIIATKPRVNDEQRLDIQTSLHSSSFKNFLRSETDNFTVKNPSSIERFDQTFVEPLGYQSPEELSHLNGNPVPARSTTFSTEHKGKRTCYVKVMNLLDISASPSLVSKDCTPNKTFDLKLNKPNNG